MFTKETLHHFYLVEHGDAEEALRAFILDELGIREGEYPDYIYREYAAMGIDDAREVKDFFTTRSLSEGRKVAYIRADGLTREAQNALLKLTEEPAPGQHLFFALPSVRTVISTLASRAQIVESGPSGSDGMKLPDLFELAPGERLTAVSKIISKKDKEKARALVDAAIKRLQDLGDMRALKEAAQIRTYIDDRSSSLKLLLEHLCLILPACTTSKNSRTRSKE